MTYTWEQRPADYSGYWPGDDGFVPAYIGRSAQSDVLEESNFAAALDRLHEAAEAITDEPPSVSVYVHRASHWAAGWVESIWVAAHPDLVARVMQLREALEQYPVLDEDDYSRREWEDLQDALKDATDAAYRSLDDRYGMTFDYALAHVMAEVSDDGQWRVGEDVDWDYVERLVQDEAYDRAWIEAHVENRERTQAQLKGQLPLWVQG